jgi:hypothetical protein
VEFESPHPAAASLAGLLPTRSGSPRTARTLPSSWEPSPAGPNSVVLAGRATRVPQPTVTSVMQRSVMVSSRRSVGWALVPDLGWGRRPKLHCMQGVASQSLANVSTQAFSPEVTLFIGFQYG